MSSLYQPHSYIMKLQVNQANLQFNIVMPSILTLPLLSAVIQHTQTKLIVLNR